MPKKTIAVDIDDVLAANAETFIRYSNERWGTNLTPDDWTEHWAEMWKVDYEEEQRRRDIIVSEKLFLKHRIYNEAKPVLIELKKKYELVIVSSRGPSIQKDTIEWINGHFKDIFTEFHFAKIWGEPLHTIDKLKLTKGELLKEIGAGYLIDDQPKHCLAAAEAGIEVLLFGDYGWNRHTKLLANMARVENWQEVKKYFDAKK